MSIVNDYGHLEAFFHRLESPKLWEKVVDDIKALRDTSEDGGWLEGMTFSEAGYRQRIDFDLFRTFNYYQMASSFQKHLLAQFAFPPVSATELSDLARDHLAGAFKPDEMEMAIARFQAHVARLTHYSTDDINFCFGVAAVLKLGTNELPEEIRNCERIYSSTDGFWIAFNSELSVYQAPELDVCGKFSDDGIKKIADVVSRIAPSASRTLHLVNCDPNIEDEYGFIPFEVDTGAVWDDFKRREESFFSAMLESFFLAPTKKASSLEQRLRNAIHLLVEADNQESVAISLSLSFAAIEAVVCTKTHGIVEELSRNVASLLEPNNSRRLEAIAGIKKLYDIRSKALHGASIEGDEKAKWRARCLAAAVVKAVVEWREHAARLGDTASRKNFLDELRSLSVTGNVMEGVSDTLSRYVQQLK